MQTFKYAHENGLKSLYRYQPFDIKHPHHEEWLIQALRDRKIKLSDPSKFNDPWDCKVWYNYDLSDPEIFDNWLRFFEKNWRDQNRYSTNLEYKEKIQYIRDNPENLKEEIEKYQIISQKVVDYIRVYCLTFCNDNTLMWSHYADNHKGICMEFDTTHNFLKYGYEVKYKEEYPIIHLSNDDPHSMLTPFVTKSIAWQYEREYRLIAFNNREFEGMLYTEDSLFIIPQNSIKSIIIGCRMGDDSKKRLIEIIKEHDSTIKIKEARHVKNRYDLSIDDVGV